MENRGVLCIVIVFILTEFWACQIDVRADEGVCTQEFQSIGLKVLGDSLTDFYTVRLSTSDTIRRSTGVESQTHWYLVLDDSYQRQLANKQESFRFIGKQGQRVLIQQDYIIAADHCHVKKVSGISEIQL
ncbi:MAG: hypothetical protein EOP45_20315 [Sphingobacteriaceae bacterium]|nr:MAG: hypothetical protein EOP45_20315 [Sphingobacteriaceae bacterium]